MTCSNHPDRPVIAFCQNCGKPLCTECARTVGQAVFCEPCLAARLAAADASRPNPGPTYTTVPPTSTVPPPTAPPLNTPNPGVALLLGFIPGVGAMYNGQYAKGVVHLVVFAIFVSLADQSSFFGLLLAGWIFYQAVEAYQTARARRDGTPLPNPFNLNDIGDRLGFMKSTPAPPAQPTATPFTPAPPPPGHTYNDPWGAPQDVFTPVPPPSAAPYTPSTTGSSSVPVGALVLIGLGILFLLGNTHWLGSLPLHLLLPVLLIGLGGWLFVRRMTSTGFRLADDGSAAYRLRLIRALDGSVWIMLVGVLFLLDSLRILTWAHSWPLFIIVGGALALLRRNAYTSFTPPPYPVPPPTPPPSPNPGSPVTSRESEERPS